MAIRGGWSYNSRQLAQLHQGQFLQASGGVGIKEGDLRPPLVSHTHPLKVANRRISRHCQTDQAALLWATAQARCGS
jgi:hypothetical protein